jgi:Rieske Fe-S protein
MTRTSEAEVKAFGTTCPHQGCLVTDIRNGRIVCPCHGSEFNITDGSVAKGPDTGQPLRQGLSPRQVTVTGGSFTVS